MPKTSTSSKESSPASYLATRIGKRVFGVFPDENPSLKSLGSPAFLWSEMALAMMSAIFSLAVTASSKISVGIFSYEWRIPFGSSSSRSPPSFGNEKCFMCSDCFFRFVCDMFRCPFSGQSFSVFVFRTLVLRVFSAVPEYSGFTCLPVFPEAPGSLLPRALNMPV